MGNFTAEEFTRFTRPNSVALIGLTSKTGPGSYNALEIMLASGFRGKVYPVHPNADEILGYKVYRSVLELPEVPDLVMVSTPRNVVPDVIKDCGEKGVRSVIIITQGFGDGDEEGRKMQQEIVAVARASGIRIVGPNTLGVINNFDGFNTSFVNFINKPAATGVVCQSGIFFCGAAEFFGGVGIGVDTGNTSDVDFADVLEHLASDERIRVINLHMEGISNGSKFIEAARRASAWKPVLALKTGVSKVGAAAARSHSGSLAGEDYVFDAAFRRAGVIRVKGVEEMQDLNKTFLTHRKMAGPRIGVVTFTGGGGIIAADACERHGLEMAKFSKATLSALREIFPAWMEPGNPVDVWPAGMSRGYHQVYRRVLEAVLADPQVDAVLCLTAAYLPPEEDYMDNTGLIREVAAAGPDKPVAVWAFGPRYTECARALEEGEVLTAFPSADRAARALGALHRNLNVIRPTVPDGRCQAADIDFDRSRAAEILARHPGGLLPANAAMEIIQAYGIPAAVARAAAKKEEAIALAEEMGYPLAMKVVSPDISHKSDVGGVKLNLCHQGEVAAAYEAILDSVRLKAPGARVDGVILQPFRAEGIEVLLGCKRDPQFGPVILCGAGGILTELIRDVSFSIAPVDHEDALAMLQETRLYQLLLGMRGTPPANLEALASCIVRLSQLAVDFPEIGEIDLNPLLAGSTGAKAVDCRIVLQQT